jgi:hypothetical protein
MADGFLGTLSHFWREILISYAINLADWPAKDHGALPAMALA